MCPKHSFEDCSLLVQFLLLVSPGKAKPLFGQHHVCSTLAIGHIGSSSVVNSWVKFPVNAKLQM